MKNKFIVNKKDFSSNFLGTIVDFKSDIDFVPIHYTRGYLVYFSMSITDKGCVYVFCQHKPVNSDFEDGDVFYLHNPARINNLIRNFDGDKIAFGITDDQIISKGNNCKFRLKLHDAKTAVKNKEFLKPEKFFEIQNGFNDGIDINKETLKKLKNSCSLFDDNSCKLVVEDDDVMFTIGDPENNGLELNIGSGGEFNKIIPISKLIFTALKGVDATVCQNEKGNIICAHEEIDDTKKFFLTPRVKE